MTFSSTAISQKQSPAGLKWVKLGDVCLITDYVANGSFASLKENVEYKREPDYAVLIRLVDYHSNWNRENFVYVTQNAYAFLRKSSLQVGDIVVSNVGSLGMCFVVPELEQPMTLGPNAIVVRPFDESTTASAFIYQWLLSPFAKARISSISTTTAQPKFNKTEFRETLIPLPPLEEQKRIAGILNRADEAKKAAEEQLEAALALMQVSLSEIFEGDISKDWPKKSMSDWADLGFITKVQDGNHGERHPKTTEYVNEGIPFLMARDIVDGHIDSEKASKITATQSEQLRVGHSQSADVLLSHKGTIGITALVPDTLPKSVLSPQLTFYRVHDEKLSNRFLRYAFMSPGFQNTIQSMSGQGTRAYVPLRAQSTIKIRIPSKEIQNTIVRRADSIQSLVTLARKQTLDTESLQAALLRRAFTGEL